MHRGDAAAEAMRAEQVPPAAVNAAVSSSASTRGPLARTAGRPRPAALRRYMTRGRVAVARGFDARRRWRHFVLNDPGSVQRHGSFRGSRTAVDRTRNECISADNDDGSGPAAERQASRRR